MKRQKLKYIIPHILFLALAVCIFLPSQSDISDPWIFMGTVVLIEAILIFRRKSYSACGISAIVFTILLVWEIYSDKLPLDGNFLFPPPENVFAVFRTDFFVIISSIGTSFGLLAVSFLIAIVLGVTLGIICGRHERPRNIVLPIAQVISPIPGLIYAPYAIALLSGFRAASVFIIANGLFWPMLLNVINKVSQMDKKLADSAQTLNLKEHTVLFHILLPYCIPSIFTTLSLQISNSFLLLIGAEMLGATSGVGWYVKYHSDFSDYTKVIAGFIVIGLLVSLVNAGLKKLRKLSIPWEQV